MLLSMGGENHRRPQARLPINSNNIPQKIIREHRRPQEIIGDDRRL